MKKYIKYKDFLPSHYVDKNISKNTLTNAFNNLLNNKDFISEYKSFKGEK